MVFVSDQHADDIAPQSVISWLFSDPPSEPDRPLLIDAKDTTNGALSWNQVKDLVHKLTAGFRKHGIKPGDCVCIIGNTRNTLYFPSVYALIAAGATFFGLPTRRSPGEEPVSNVESGGITHFLTEPESLPDVLAAVDASFNGDLSRVLVFSGRDHVAPYEFEGRYLTSWASLLTHGSAKWEMINDLETAKSRIALRLLTSATTGPFKNTEISHYAAIAHIEQWARSFKTHAFEVTSLYYLSLHPLSGYGFVTTAMKLGFPVYFIERSIPDMIHACKTLKPSLIMIDPFTLMQIVKTVAHTGDAAALHSLRDVRIPLFSLPPDGRKLAERTLHPDCLMSRPYGMTEAGTISAMLYSQRESHDPQSVGYTFPGVHIKLIDDDGGGDDGEATEITSHDTPGAIYIKTPALFSRYYGNEQATAAAIRPDGWFDTGDIGYISSTTKQWYLVGRKAVIFKVKGTYIAPEDIESVLVSHQDIADAAVAPLPKAEEGQVDPLIKAFVVRQPGTNLTVEDVISFVEGRLPVEKRITGGVEFVESVLRTVSSKVNRKVLQDIVAKQTRARGVGIRRT